MGQVHRSGRFLAAALMGLALALGACGGGGGAAPPSAVPGPDAATPPPQSAGVTRVAAELKTLAEGPEDPIVAADRLAAAIDDLHAKATDTASAEAELDRAYAQTIDTAAAYQALEARRRLLGGWIDKARRSGAAAKLRAVAGGQAALTEDPDTGEGLVVYFINGIGVDFGDWEDSRLELESIVHSILPQAQVTGMHNESATDAEVSHFGGAIAALPDPLAMPLYHEVVKALVRQIGGLLIDLGQSFDQWLVRFGLFGSEPLAGVGQADEMADDLEGILRQGNKVVLVPHSQGNFFARDALRILRGRQPAMLQDIGVVMTGSPEKLSVLEEILGDDARARMVHNVDDPVPALSFADPLCQDGCVKRSQSIFERLSRTWRMLANHFFKSGYLRDQPLALLKSEIRALAELLLAAGPDGHDSDEVPGAFQALAANVTCGPYGPVAEIAWTSSARADTYEVFMDGRAVSPRLPGIRAYELREGLVPGEVHQLFVRAHNAHGHSDTAPFTATVPVDICAPPGSLALQVVQPVCEGAVPTVKLAWTPAQGATSYRVYRDGLSASGVLDADQVTYVDRANLEPKRTYRYSVRAFNAHGTAESVVKDVSLALDICEMEEPADADLVIDLLTAEALRAAPGDEVAVRIDVRNAGEGEARASVAHLRISSSSLRVDEDDPLLAAVGTDGLMPGSQTTLRPRFTTPDLPSGTWYVWALLDVNDTANQANRANDRAYFAFEIEVPPPDKQQTRMDVVVSPASLEQDQAATITATLRDAATNIPLAGKLVDIGVGALNVGGGLTDASGRVTVTRRENRIGTLEVEAIFGGDAGYLASSDSAALTVTPAAPKVTRMDVVVAPANLEQNQTATITATLRDAATNSPVAGKLIDIGVGALNVGGGLTDASGRVTVTRRENRIGTLEVEAIFGGDAGYRASSDSATLTVRPIPPKATRIKLTLSPRSLDLGEKSVAKLKLEEKAFPYHDLEGKTVSFLINGTVVWTGTSDKDGEARVTINGNSAGTHTIAARFGGDSTHLASSDSATLTVRPIPPKATRIKLTLSPRSLDLGEKSVAKLKLEEKAFPYHDLEGKTVSFLINGTVVWTGTSDKDGEARVTINGNSAGTHTITARFGGDSTHLASSDSETLTVKTAPPKATRIKLTLSPRSLDLGEKSVAKLKLEEKAFPYRGIEGKTVSFLINGTVAWTGTSDKDGEAHVTINGNSAGTHTITARFGGDSTHLASSDSETLTVRAKEKDGTRITLSFSPGTAEVGEATRIRAKLEDDSALHYDLKSKRVKIFVNGSLLRSGYTDSNGVVYGYYTATTLSRRTVYAEFGGDDDYEKSSTQKYLYVEDTTDPTRVNLRSPSNDAVTYDRTPLLRWYAASDGGGVVGYELEMQRKGVVLYGAYLGLSTSRTDFTPSTMPRDRYRWRVRAIDNSGNKGWWSSWWYFDVK